MTESGSIFTVHLEDWGEAKSYKHPAPASWRLEPAEEIDCDEVKLAINDGTVFIPKSQSRHCSIQCFGSGDLRKQNPSCKIIATTKMPRPGHIKDTRR